MATFIILIMPLITEVYELRKFMIERASVEPGSPVQVDVPVQVITRLTCPPELATVTGSTGRRRGSWR